MPALLAAALLLVLPGPASPLPKKECTATRQDEIGPFYRPGAPRRTSMGKGYLLEGTVRSTRGCRPIAGARIEVWQAGPGGVYDETHRATLYSDRRGRYRLETSVPPPYLRRPPHIHILVDAAGYAGLITQHYPVAGTRTARFDLVLEPE